MPERLYIVDGHGYVFRAHYGLMNVSRGERKEVRLSTAEGMPSGELDEEPPKADAARSGE